MQRLISAFTEAKKCVLFFLFPFLFSFFRFPLFSFFFFNFFVEIQLEMKHGVNDISRLFITNEGVTDYSFFNTCDTRYLQHFHRLACNPNGDVSVKTNVHSFVPRWNCFGFICLEEALKNNVHGHLLNSVYRNDRF